MRDGEIHLGTLKNIRNRYYYVVDILDEGEIRLRREEIEHIGGVTDGYCKDYPPM